MPRRPKTRGINAGILRDEVRRTVNIFSAEFRFVGIAGRAVLPPIGSVHRNRDVAKFGQALRVETRDLLLHAAIGVRDHHGWIFLARIVVRRRVDVGGNIQAIELIFGRVDIDLARLVLRDSAVIDQGERIL